MSAETRTVKHRPRKADKGHSVVATSETRVSEFRSRWKLTCQCGKTFGSRTSADRNYYAYSAHLKAATS